MPKFFVSAVCFWSFPSIPRVYLKFFVSVGRMGGLSVGYCLCFNADLVTNLIRPCFKGLVPFGVSCVGFLSLVVIVWQHCSLLCLSLMFIRLLVSCELVCYLGKQFLWWVCLGF
jgi:hypothetical protein